jgi:glutamyl-tRNA synthetase
VNFLALLAYPPKQDNQGNDVEVFSFAEFSKDFEWRKINPVGPIFDLKKLEWLNGVYIRELALEDLAARLLPYLVDAGVLSATPTLGELGRLKDITALIQTRIALLSEAAALVRPFYVADDALEIADDARAELGDGAPAVLDAAIKVLDDIPATQGNLLGEGAEWTSERIESALRSAIVEGLGIKPKLAFGPLRTAVSGQRISPPLFESMQILGKHSTLARVRSLRTSLG